MSALRTPTELSQAIVGDVMHRGVISVAPDARLTTVAATMAAHAVHAAVLLGPRRNGALVVTDLDVIRAALGGRFEAAAVEVAREPLLGVAADERMERALALMATRDVSHLLVSDPHGEWPAGVLSSLDVMAVLSGRDPGITRILRPGPARPLVSATDLAATTVAAVMHPGVVTCLPDNGLEPVAGTMADLRIHCVAVVGAGDGGHFVWGLVTDMDVLHAAYRGVPVTAGEIAASSPLALPADTELDRAAALMTDHDTAHVVVVDRGGRPAGVVSTLDVLRIVAAC
jgi:CBS domain-containing protein